MFSRNDVPFCSIHLCTLYFHSYFTHCLNISRFAFAVQTTPFASKRILAKPMNMQWMSQTVGNSVWSELYKIHVPHELPSPSLKSLHNLYNLNTVATMYIYVQVTMIWHRDKAWRVEWGGSSNPRLMYWHTPLPPFVAQNQDQCKPDGVKTVCYAKHPSAMAAAKEESGNHTQRN